MTEAVIVATARSPIGRAGKGSLVSMRPDDMSAQIVKALLAKVPQVQPSDIEDLIMGMRSAGRRGGLQHRPRRRDPRRSRRRPRRHGQPLLLEQPADHPHGRARDQGRRGRLLHRRRRRGRQPLRQRRERHRTELDLQAVGRSAPPSASQGGQGTWTPPAGLPDIYIAMGQTAENVVEVENVSREEMDAFAQALAGPRQREPGERASSRRRSRR